MSDTGDTPERAQEKRAAEHEAEDKRTDEGASRDEPLAEDIKEEGAIESVPAARTNRPTG